MKAAYLTPRILAFIGFFLIVNMLGAQDFSAGINTETPNPNAVLHLVAPNNDQGLLIPTLTTAQRTTMAASLTAADNGMLVFDTDLDLFFFYVNGVTPNPWIGLTTGGTELDGDVTNELITAGTLAGNTLTITEAGIDHNIDLSAFASAPQDLQFAGNLLSVTGDPTPTAVDFSTWDQNAADDITTANVGTAANQIVQLDGTGALPAVDGSNLTGILSTVTSDGTTITGDGAGTPLAVGTLPAAQVSGLAPIATTGSFADLTLVPVGLGDGDDVGIADLTTILGDGAGTPYAVNTGTGAGQIVQLDPAGALPAVDGSNLTGIAPTLAAGSVTTTEIADGTIADIDVSGTANIAATKLQTNVMLETENISLLNNDAGYLATVATDITLVGDGAGTPLSLNRVNPAIITGGGATPGQILEFDGTNWVPINNVATVNVDGATITGDGNATPLSVNSIPSASVTGLSTVATTGNFADLLTIPAGLADGDDVGLATVNVDGTTIIGDGDATALSVDATALTIANTQVTGLGTASTADAGSVPGELLQLPTAIAGDILEYDGANWVTGVDDTGLTTVTSADITDDEIVNADINTAANIAATKLQGNVMLETENISLLNNDANYVASGDNVSVLTNDAGYIDAATYDPNTIAGDAFAFNTHVSATAAISGDVLTYNGTDWDAAAPIGLTLPFSQTVGDAGNLFAVTNTGLGGSGFFTVNNALSGANALNASTNGTGTALNVTHSGTGVGAGIDVTLNQATSTGSGITVNHAGLGPGIEINTTTGPPIFIPGGAFGEVLTSDALGNLTLQPGGLNLPYSQTVADAGFLFQLANTGNGGVADFQINNAASPGNVLDLVTNGNGAAFRAQHTGLGVGAQIQMLNTANTSPTLDIFNDGVGQSILVNNSNALNTLPAIEVVNTGSGPDIKLPSGAAVGYVLTSTDALGNAVWQPGGLSLPYANSLADPGPLFSLSNSGAGSAAFFENTTDLTALRISGNVTFAEGVLRSVGMEPNTVGPGDIMYFYSGDAGGTGGDGGDLVLGSGNAAVAGNGGNIVMTTGSGAGGSFGELFLNGVTTFRNQNVGSSARIELENDPGTAFIGIESDPAMASSYTIRLPAAQGTGALTNDGAGILTWAPAGLTFPSSTIQSDADTLFNLTNTGSAPAAGFSAVGLAATFTNVLGGTAVLVDGNMEFLDGADKDFGILPNLTGPGDLLNVYSGDAGGPGGDGGDLILSSGLASGTGNGGNILITPGAGAGPGFAGGVFVNGITRFGNPNAGFGGLLELENDAGTFSIGIEADPTMAADYVITMPAAQGAGALTNDGAGVLSWSPIGFTAPFYDDLTNVVFGTTTPVSVIPSPDFQLGSVAPSGQASLSASSHALQSRVPLLRANGTEGGELALQAADVIGELAFVGHDGIDYFRQGMIRGVATENWSGVARGTALSFSATPAGTTVDREVMRIGGNGLQIKGVPRINNPVPLEGGTIQLEDDTGVDFLSIQASDTTSTYKIVFPAAQGTGALTNDGTGTLTWATAAGAGFTLDAAGNLLGNTTVPALTTGRDNFFAGVAAGSGLTTGTDNIFIGQNAGTSIQGGFFNVGLGLNAGSSLATGGDNVLIGQSTGLSLIAGVENVAIGQGADVTDDSNQNVNIGAGSTTAGGLSVAIGVGASATGASSTAVGDGATASGIRSMALGAGVVAANDFTAVIGDPTVPINVGIGTAAPASRLEVQTASGESTDLLTLTHGASLGRALVIDVPVGGSPDPAILIAQNSTGAGIDARVTNSASNATLITAQHQGDGNVAFFNQGNNLSGADAMFVQTLGLGAAGVFQISNSGSGAPALAVNTDGDNSNAIAISKAGLNGAGIRIDMNNQGSNGLFIGATAAGENSISVDGGIELRTNFTTISNPTAFDVNLGLPIPITHRVLKLIGNSPFNQVEVAGARDGQELILVCEAGATPQADPGASLRLDNGSSLAMSAGSTLHLIYIETLGQWVEIGRSR